VLLIIETELKLMVVVVIIGLSSSLKIGYSMLVAIGMFRLLYMKV